MPQSVKKFYVEIGEHLSTSFDEEYYGDQVEADGLFWSVRGGYTDSFPEAEARSILFSKTYKNVRIGSQENEIVTYVEG